VIFFFFRIRFEVFQLRAFFLVLFPFFLRELDWAPIPRCAVDIVRRLQIHFFPFQSRLVERPFSLFEGINSHAQNRVTPTFFLVLFFLIKRAAIPLPFSFTICVVCRICKQSLIVFCPHFRPIVLSNLDVEFFFLFPLLWRLLIVSDC